MIYKISHQHWVTISRFFFLLGLVISVLALVVYWFFSEKTLQLYPNPAYDVELYGYADKAEGPSAYWVDKAQNSWACNYKPDNPYGCGWDVKLGREEFPQVDLSSYNRIEVDLDYQGSAKRIRTFLRDYNPTYTYADDPTSTKVMQTSFATAELGGTLSIDLASYSVANWWLLENAERQFWPQTELNAVTQVGFDFIEHGLHQVTVKSLRVVGPRIAIKTLLLLVLGYWMFVLVLDGVALWLRVYFRAKAESRTLRQFELRHQQLSDENLFLSIESELDPLTGILNRKGLEKKVEALQQQRGGMHNWVLMVLDLDHFKNINDQFGHDVGDKVLRAFASVLSVNMRKNDVFARLGGEEFIVLHPNQSVTHTRKFAEKLNDIVHKISFDVDGIKSVSVSIGVALGRRGEDFAQLFRRADAALLTAKQSGRNRVKIDLDSDEESGVGD